MNEVGRWNLKSVLSYAGFILFCFLLYAGVSDPTKMFRFLWWLGVLILSGIVIAITPKDTRGRKMAYATTGLVALLALITLTINWPNEAKVVIFGIIALFFVMWLVQRNEPIGPLTED